MIDRGARAKRLELGAVLVIALVVFIVILTFFSLLHFDLLHGTDSKAYLNAAENLSSFPPLELPGYPFAVAVAGSLFPQINPAFYMQAISLASYIGSVAAVYLLFDYYRLRLAFWGTLIFALYPSQGVTMSVFPRVNALMYLCVAAACLLYVKQLRWPLVIVLAITLFTHKSAWAFVAIMVAIGLYERKLRIFHAICVAIPLMVYWAVGAQHHQDTLWLLSSSASIKFDSRESTGFRVLGGLMATIENGLTGDIPDLVKGTLIIGILSLALFLLWSRVWASRRWLLALIVPVIIWPVLLNANELWSSFAYLSTLAVPLVFLAEERFPRLANRRWLWAGIVAACLASQFVWAVYTVRYMG